VINVCSQNYDDTLEENDRKFGALIHNLPDTKAVRDKLLSLLGPSTDSDSNEHRIGLLTNYHGYFNPEGGWAEATRAVATLLSHVKELGGRVIASQEVASLMKDGHGRTTGVKCKDGACFEGDRVILTVGPWTASTFPELHLDSKCLATGQTVGMIQLSAEEKERHKSTPVFLDFDTGFYTLPPTEDGIVKLGMHMAGHTHMISTPQIDGDIGCNLARKISTPRTITSHPHSGDGLRVPRPALQALRMQLRKVYPELGEKPWSATRLCWYTDAPDGDWVIGPFPGDPTLILATSGSGHGFKFLPNVGRLVVDCLEGVLDPDTAAKFAVDRDIDGAINDERASALTQELDPEELCGPGEELGV